MSPLRMAAFGDRAEREPAGTDDDWLRRFHAGERRCLEGCYREHLGAVDGVIAAVLRGADRETLVHEVFFRLLSDETLRRGFNGGSFVSWLRVVARNQAIDYVRRRRLEVSFTGDDDSAIRPEAAPDLERQMDVRLTLERFRERVLPPRWRPVFDARFLAQQDQPTAARAIGMRRTTLAYQEYRIRRLLHRFVLRGETT